MKAKKVFCVLMAIIFCITLLPNTVLATSDNARYLMDAETLPDGTIAVLFIKGGTASSGTISGGALYYGVYDPSNDEWTEEPVGETAPTAKEAALALDGSTAHVAYVNSDDEIAYTYQRRSGWADEEIIESNNCNEKVGVLSSVDICVDNEGNAYISYIDTQGAEDDSYRKPDGMYATNASGKFVKTVIANCTGYGDSWGRWYDEMVAPIKIAAGDEKVQVSFDIHTYDWTNGSGAWNGYAFHFTANGTSLDTNSSGRVVDVCSDGTDFYTLLSQSGKYFVVNDNVKIEETELTTTVTAADITIDDSEIYYATISGTTLNFYQDGTFVEDVTADTAILSGYNRFTTVICDGEQYVIYTGSDEDNSLVISKLDGDEMVEFLVPNPPSTYSVTITIADNMTKTSGEDEQDVIVEEDMTDVVYEANEGYCFPETYEVDGENGVTVTRNSATQITVSGTPTDDVEIVLIAPSAHTEADPVTENTVDATCTEDGSYDEVVYCSNCGVELSRTQEIIPASHTEADPVEENTIDPTCTEAGSYDEVIYCSVCGEELSRTPNEIPATGHTDADPVEENTVDPTCTEAGSYDEVIYCSTCNEELSRTPNVIPATGHTDADPVEENTVDPTCTEDGSYDEVIYCSTCGEELSRTHEVIPATGHTEADPVEENTIEPTCTEAGSYDEVIYCSTCNEELSRTPNEIPATGHTEADAVTENEVPVTCEEDGSYDEVIYCSVCGEEISRTPNEIPATGHTEADPVTENEVPVTCEEDGSYDEVIYCSTCGEELSRTPHVVPALTHDWSEPTYDWAADNSSVTATRVCGNDETHIQTEQVNTISEVTLDPTVEAPGETTYTATFEAEYFEEQTLTIANIPALILIEEVAFNNVTLPIHGDEYFEPALDDGEHYTVSYASWTDEKYGTPDTFEADHTYYLTIGLVPESGYVFADELNVYINDDEPVSVRTEDVLDGTEIKIAIDVPNNTHTVTFDEGEEVLQPYSTLTGANGKLDEIPNPTKQRSGYNFKGWYTEATDGTKITTDTIFTEDTTVFAQWTRKTSSGGGGSSSPTTYKVTVATIENGKVTSSATSASKGTTITLTVTPNENYELDKIEVTTKNGEKVTLAGENNKYTFSMPNSDVTVNATFATEEYIIIDEDGENEENEGNKENETTSGLQFSDVHEEDYFFGAVNWAIDHNITSGTSKTTFSPDNSATRAQTVTFIWNAAGKPTPTTTNNPFTDVNENDYYYKAVLWAYENGVTAGTSETTFSPDNIVTRAQAVTFLYNLSNANSEGENPFTDVTEEDYFFNSVIWAYTNNITHGTTKTTFSPNNDCTRAQIVTFLYNYYSNL
ncbi:MAG: S-layer homology domain-containing protein [Clostridia bacterium]|nr:S-layer homology domain-containing protein [Clostridia bacterium]